MACAQGRYGGEREREREGRRKRREERGVKLFAKGKGEEKKLIILTFYFPAI